MHFSMTSFYIGTFENADACSITSRPVLHASMWWPTKHGEMKTGWTRTVCSSNCMRWQKTRFSMILFLFFLFCLLGPSHYDCICRCSPFFRINDNHDNSSYYYCYFTFSLFNLIRSRIMIFFIASYILSLIIKILIHFLRATTHWISCYVKGFFFTRL